MSLSFIFPHPPEDQEKKKKNYRDYIIRFRLRGYEGRDDPEKNMFML